MSEKEEELREDFLKVRRDTREITDKWRVEHPLESAALEAPKREEKKPDDVVNADTLGGMSLQEILHKARMFGGGGGTGDSWGDEVDASLVPDADDAYDLGSATKEFKDLYIDGTAYVDILDMGTGRIDFTGEGIGLSIIDAGILRVHDEGGATGTYRNINARGFSCSGGGVTNAAELDPEGDGTRDIGKAASQWRDLYLDGWAYIDSLRVDVALDCDAIDINATGLGSVTAVIPVTVEAGTGYIPVYDGYT